MFHLYIIKYFYIYLKYKILTIYRLRLKQTILININKQNELPKLALNILHNLKDKSCLL